MIRVPVGRGRVWKEVLKCPDPKCDYGLCHRRYWLNTWGHRVAFRRSLTVLVVFLAFVALILTLFYQI